MRETLFIRLRSAMPDAPTAYCIAPADAALSFEVREAPLTEVLAQAAARRVIVLVDSADVRLASVSVPARAPAKVLQAAPYALEEQLAEDVDTLHFALGPRLPEGAWPVAIVSHATMAAWLAPFRDAGVRPEALIPEVLCLPAPEHGGAARWSALAENEQITVRTAVYAGFACTPEDLPLYLQLAQAAPETALRIVVPRSYAADLTQLPHPTELLPGFESPLAALLQHYVPERAINLLQGAYSQREDFIRLWQPWRAAAALAAAWILVAATTHAVQAYRLGAELRQQDEHNAQRFRELFPAEQRIVDLAAQAEQQMTLLRGGGAKGSFLPLLQVAGDALAAAPGLRLQTLQFRDGALFVSLGGSDLQQLETLRGWFTQNPRANMEVQSANSGADGVQIRLKLTPT